MGAPICVSPIPSDIGGSGEDTTSVNSERDPSDSMVDTLVPIDGMDVGKHRLVHRLMSS